MNLPQFSTMTTKQMEAMRQRAAMRKATPRKRKTIVRPAVSVVGYMRTIQADRRDAAIMSRYAFAAAREAARQATSLAEVES